MIVFFCAESCVQTCPPRMYAFRSRARPWTDGPASGRVSHYLVLDDLERNEIHLLVLSHEHLWRESISSPRCRAYRKDVGGLIVIRPPRGLPHPEAEGSTFRDDHNMVM